MKRLAGIWVPPPVIVHPNNTNPGGKYYRSVRRQEDIGYVTRGRSRTSADLALVPYISTQISKNRN